ncbi:PilZ domain-containing protein [Myxococcota bacterium]|nr:PilZ domain-containing protein [Myxococcota bacterium]
MSERFQNERRFPRYVAHCEVHVEFGARKIVTITREISRSGLFFFADPPPEAGTAVRCVLLPDDAEPLGISCTTRYVMPGVGAGVEVATSGDPAEAARFAAFVEDQAVHTSAWRVIGGFVRSAEDGDASAIDGIDVEPKEMLDVGETGEAYRVFFERYPAQPLDSSELAREPQVLEHARQLLSGIAVDTVGIKLHARDRLRTALLGVLADGRGFVALVRAKSGETAFYALSGREQLVIRVAERGVFPFFTSSDLQRIQRDSARVVAPEHRTPPPTEQPGSISARWARVKRDAVDTMTSAASPISSLSDWTRYDEMTAQILVDLFDVLPTETRVYVVGGAERTVRLLRHLTVMVREPSGAVDEATLMFDGRRLSALFGMKNRADLRIRPLLPSDQVRLPAW